MLKARLSLTMQLNVLNKHRIRPHPQAAMVVQRAIQDQWLKRLAMPYNAQDLIFSTFLVTVAAQGQTWQGGKLTHGCKDLRQLCNR